MLKKPAGCEGCPLAAQKGYVPGRYPPGATVLVMGSYPTLEELAKGEAYSGPSSKEMVEKGLALAGLDRGEVAFDYTLRCAPPTKKGKPAVAASVLAAATAHCAQYDQSLKGITLVLAQGPIALRKYYSGALKPHELRGHLIPEDGQ